MVRSLGRLGVLALAGIASLSWASTAAGDSGTGVQNVAIIGKLALLSHHHYFIISICTI